jgi:hypothetical protein
MKPINELKELALICWSTLLVGLQKGFSRSHAPAWECLRLHGLKDYTNFPRSRAPAWECLIFEQDYTD